MASRMQLTNLVEVRFYCTMGTQVSVMTRHWQVIDQVGLGGLDTEFGTALAGVIPTQIKELMSNQAQYYGMTVQVIKPVRLVDTTNIVNRGAGAIVSDALPPQVAGRVRFYTSVAGRSARGRLYAPFPYEAANNVSGLPAAAYITDLTALTNSLLASYAPGAVGNTSTLQAVLYSRKLNSAAGFSSALIQTRWGTQRRRSLIGQGDMLPF